MPKQTDQDRNIDQEHVNNRLLRSLPPSDFSTIRPFLTRAKLRRGQVLQENHRAVDNVYFIESGAASLFLRTKRDGLVGVAIVARYGLTGVPVVLGTSYSPYRCTVLIAGEAIKIASSDLQAVMATCASLRQILNRYVHALMVQHAQLVLCASRHNLDERLSAWLLAISDRIESRNISITHDLVSHMLGVRRPSVTAAIASLERSGAVAGGRGQLLIVDRSKLEKLSCECYENMRLEYSRLLGVDQ